MGRTAANLSIAVTLLLTACTTSSTAHPTIPTEPGTVVALHAELTIAPETDGGVPYDRALYPHWHDPDGNGCDARQDVLIRDALNPPQIDPYRCFLTSSPS